MRDYSRAFALIFGLSTCMFMVNCKEEDSVANNCEIQLERTCVGYLETYCSDSWGNGYTSDGPLIADLIDFFEDRNIELIQIHIEDTSSPEVCNACSCKTGRTIIGSVANEDLQAIKELGFFER